LIIADNVEGEALNVLILNRLRGSVEVCAVKAPGFGDAKQANLQDIAVLTGAQLVSEEAGIKLEEIDIDQLGSAKKVTVTKDDTLILGGVGDKKLVEERCNLIKQQLKDEKVGEYDKEKLSERLAKLSGGVAVIKIGGASQVEVNEKKDRITDALNATRAAVSEGIVAGGGSALLFASKSLEPLKKEIKQKNLAQGQGVQIVQDALKRPCKTISDNAGIEGSVVVEHLLAQNDVNMGYDAQNGVYTDMIKTGIIDPVKVVKTALRDAASVASLMTTTEAIIVEVKKKNAGGAGGMGGMGGGMGGMGGMDM